MQTYRVAETFYSLQGEGRLAGKPYVFVRFVGCNLRCDGEEKDGVLQPVCDTDFTGPGLAYSADTLVDRIFNLWRHGRPGTPSVLWTGGEPALQLDQELVDACAARGMYQAIETNGTRELPQGLTWVTVSPKTAEHTIVVRQCDELKFVRRAEQSIPKTAIEAGYYVLSPHVSPEGTITRADLEWCIRLCKENPKWHLSVQQHKQWGVR